MSSMLTSLDRSSIFVREFKNNFASSNKLKLSASLKVSEGVFWIKIAEEMNLFSWYFEKQTISELTCSEFLK